MSVVNHLKETRKAMGIDQKELSCATGFSIRTISRIEQVAQAPSAEFMLRVSRYLELPVEALFEVSD